MNDRTRTTVVAAILALLLTGCSTPVALRTAAAAVDACDSALAAGVLVPSPKSGLALQPIMGDATTVEVVWPFGYTAARDATGRLTLHDASGKEIAHEGDTITMSGGLDGNGTWKACAGTVENAPGI